MLNKALNFTPLKKSEKNKKKSNFFRSLTGFIKYNNATVLILAIIFIAGTGAWAQTEAGQEIIGQKETRIEGIDNTLLLAADLDNMNMDFRIEEITADDKYYFVTYTYLDLVKSDGVWLYQINEKQRKVSKSLKQDLGVYLAEELAEEYDNRIKELKKEQKGAQEQGEETRVEITEYKGLIGQSLDFVGRIFPGYEPVKIKEMPSPNFGSAHLSAIGEEQTESQAASPADNLTEVYNDYIAENDPDQDNIFGAADNCPAIYNPGQEDADDDGLGDECDLTPSPSPSQGDGSLESEEGGEIATSTASEADAAEENVDTEESTETESTEEPVEDDAVEEAASAQGSDMPTEEIEVEIIELPE